MTLVSDRLGRVQLAGHIAIDRVYADLADTAEAAVLEQANSDLGPKGTLSPLASVNVIASLRRALQAASPQLSIGILQAVQGAVIAAQMGATPLAPTTTALVVATFQARQQVSRTLQASQGNVLEQSGTLLIRAAARGLATGLIAKQLRQYFSPFFAPRRDPKGALTRADRTGAVAQWPGRAGMASASVRAVMLDQTSKLHAETTRLVAIRDEEFLRYHVSHQHLQIDECDLLERQDVGFGPGVYDPNDAPSVPRHPRCRCWYERADRPRFLTRSESV